MRISLIGATAAALLGGASLAYAANSYGANGENTVGVIKSINTAKDSVTLDNGSTYWAPKTMKLSNFKVGEKVDITYSPSPHKMGQKKMEIKTLTPAA